jgi:hypothetical protein
LAGADELAEVPVVGLVGLVPRQGVLGRPPFTGKGDVAELGAVEPLPADDRGVALIGAQRRVQPGVAILTRS